MIARRVPVIVVDSNGDRRLNGNALVESQTLDIDNDVKITLFFGATEIPVDFTNLKVEFICRSSRFGSREEIVITRSPDEPEFRIKGL